MGSGIPNVVTLAMEGRNVNFLHSVVHTGPGDAILVKLAGTEANVMVMDDINFRAYSSGSSFSFLGGHYQQSPAVIKPSSGRWNVVVDLGGYKGKVGASVSVIQ